MDVYSMRTWIEKAYPGENWKKKVRKMPDNQLVALYFRLVRSGKIKN